MIITCPGCTEYYDITNTIPSDHSGTVTCNSCNTSFDVLKQTNSLREVLGVKTICRNTQKEKIIDLITATCKKKGFFSRLLDYIKWILCIDG